MGESEEEDDEVEEEPDPEEQERRFKAACERADVELGLIEADVLNGRYHKAAYAHDPEGWGGAGLIVSTQPRWKHLAPDYPRWVRTQHAGEAAWMISRMQEAFGPLVGWGNKLGFYGRLGNAIECCQEELAGRSETALEMLAAMLTAGRKMLVEMRQGRFDPYPWDRRKSKAGPPPSVCLSVVRRLARYAWDDPKVTSFGVMLLAGPGSCAQVDVHADQACWRVLLDEKPAFLDLATKVCICDSERAVTWKGGRKKETPREATGREETLVHVEWPLANTDTFNAILKDVEGYLVPRRMSATIVCDPIPYREPSDKMNFVLNGREVGIEIVSPRNHYDNVMENPMLYERGLPVRNIDLPFHVNVLAELPDPVPDVMVSELVRLLKPAT